MDDQERSGGPKMRMIHAADLHLGCRRWLSTKPGSAELARLVEEADRRALAALVELCLAEEVRLLLCAGDVIDGWCRDYRVALELQWQMCRLRNAGCEVVLLLGNHDVRSRYLRSLLLPGYARVVGLRGPESIDFEQLGVAVHGWSAPYDLSPQASPDGAHDIARLYPPPLADRCNVGLLHTSAEGRRGHVDYAPCSRRTLREHGYQYWALGHVHQREVIAEDPWIVFPGNLQARGFREAGAKGVTAIDVQDGRIAQVQHRAVDVVRFASIVVDTEGLTHADDVWARAHQAVQELEQGAERPTLLRVVLSGVDGSSVLLGQSTSQRLRWQAQLREASSSERIWIDEVQLQPALHLPSWSLAA